MKKAFEFTLTLIIFYGMYELIQNFITYFSRDFETIWVIITSLVISTLLLLLYKAIVRNEVKKQMKGSIDILKSDIKEKENIINEKISEVKKAQTFKDNLITEAEISISKTKDL